MKTRMCGLAAGVALGLTYAGLAMLISLCASFSNNGATAASFWPASGVTLGTLLLTRSRTWPWLLLGIAGAEILVDLHNSVAASTSIVWGAANAAEPLIAVLLLGRLGVRRPDLTQRRDLAKFLACAVLVAPGVASLIASLPGGGPSLTAWLRWWIGDGLGVLIISPALLSWRTGQSWSARAAVPLLASIGIAATAAFGTIPDGGGVGDATGLIALVLPALVWLALVGGQQVGAVGLAAVALIAETATAAGRGPFVTMNDAFGGLINAQLFLAAAAVSTYLVAVVRHDLLQRDDVERALTWQAQHDPLTGLANRRALFEQISSPGSDGRLSACLLLDLDGFKAINDTYGHACGDAVLIEIADRLRRATRKSDLVARIGGDEFVICVMKPCSDDELASLVTRLTDLLAQPMMVGEAPLVVGASIGRAVPASRFDRDLDALLRRADQEMYRVKTSRTVGTFGPAEMAASRR